MAGIEAAVWCESVTDGTDLELLLLPSLAGVAEIVWSPREALDWSTYRTRLAATAPIWEQRGWTWFRSPLVDWQG